MILDNDGNLDNFKESRYLYAMKAIARFNEVMGELPCHHCTGELTTQLPIAEMQLPELPQVAQEDFLALIE